MESQIPHNPEIRKNITPWSGVGFQFNIKIKIPMWRQNAKIITGILPVNFMIEPVANAAIALATPKQIITYPILLIPQAQETKDWKWKTK